MKLKVPQKLFKIKPRKLFVGGNFGRSLDTVLFEKDEIEKEQLGYQFDLNGNPIPEWFGPEYVVIGHDYICGDPLIAKVDEPEIKFFSMFHDDWDSLTLIARSIKEFEFIAAKLEACDVTDLSSIENFKKETASIPNDVIDYWTNLVDLANEFYNEEN